MRLRKRIRSWWHWRRRSHNAAAYPHFDDFPLKLPRWGVTYDLMMSSIVRRWLFGVEGAYVGVRKDDVHRKHVVVVPR